MISNKNHITRQKNIEVIGINDDSSAVIANETNIRQKSENGITSKTNSNEETRNHINQPDNDLLNGCSSSLKSHNSNEVDDFLAIESKGILTNPIIKTGKTSNSSPNNKLQISTALKEKILRSKSPKPSSRQKPMLSTHSNPAVPIQKHNRSANFMDVNQSASFFSRSCPGEEFIERSNDEILDEKFSKMNMKTNSLREEAPPQSLKSIGKSLLAFATLKHNKNKKFADSNGSFANSNWSSVNTENEDQNDSQASFSAGPSETKKNMTKIGSFDVDMEKLARELARPTINTPLTSYSLSPNCENNNLTIKPILQTSKTIDEESGPNKKTLMRSLTNNK